VINGTPEMAARKIVSPCDLGQWVEQKRAADPVLATPDRPRALILRPTTGKGPDVMMSWLSAIPHPGRTVPCHTRPGGA